MSEREDRGPRPTEDLERRLELYRAGQMTPGERRAFEREILEDDGSAEALYGDVSMSVTIAGVATDASRRVVPIPRWRRRRTWQVIVPLAAAALVLLVLARPDRGPAPDPSTFRHPEIAARIVRPVGDLDGAPTRFVWTHDPQAEIYRVELLDATGRLVHRSTTADTILVLPDDELPADAFEGYWKVIPMNEAGIERPASSPAWIRWRQP